MRGPITRGSGLRTVGAAAGMTLVGSILTASCSTTTGGDGSASEETDGATSYVEFMQDLCASTDERIAALPTPPDQIRADLWATEVATAFAQERDRADVEASPPDDLRGDHRTYVETTGDLVDAWTALSASLAANGDDIGDRRTEVTELALGRDATAVALGLDACDRSGA